LNIYLGHAPKVLESFPNVILTEFGKGRSTYELDSPLGGNQRARDDWLIPLGSPEATDGFKSRVYSEFWHSPIIAAPLNRICLGECRLDSGRERQLQILCHHTQNCRALSARTWIHTSHFSRSWPIAAKLCFRMLDKALFSYGALEERTFST
jgi:hypothetical protein